MTSANYSENYSAGVREEAAKHVRGSTIAWGSRSYLDLARPDDITVSFEDYAYCLAYTVRWRGQCRRARDGQRVFYGTGQHCVVGARHMLREGHGAANALAFLLHESDEIPFGDFPGPAKPLIPDAVALASRIGASIDRSFGLVVPDHDLVKQFDIRMLVTERRDILAVDRADQWTAIDGVSLSSVGYEPFDEVIEPYPHPTRAAVEMIQLYKTLCAQLADAGASTIPNPRPPFSASGSVAGGHNAHHAVQAVNAGAVSGRVPPANDGNGSDGGDDAVASVDQGATA